jgi:hypothetical protein
MTRMMKAMVVTATVGFAFVAGSSRATATKIPLCDNSGCDSPEECNFKLDTYCILDHEHANCTVSWCEYRP